MINTNRNKDKDYPYWIYYLVFLAFFLPLIWICKAEANTLQKQTITMDQTKIIDSFIHFEEGKSLKGYVPKVKGSSSGVTIGYGVDLGQMHLREFDQLPISVDLKSKLKPYVGLKQEAAIGYLHAHPLIITHEQMLELSWVAKNKILQALVQSYNSYSKKPFTSLPSEAQTVIFSFAYQNGPNFKKKNGNYLLWYYFTSQDWLQASQLLKNFDTYTNRRIREAQLLEKIRYSA